MLCLCMFHQTSHYEKKYSKLKITLLMHGHLKPRSVSHFESENLVIIIIVKGANKLNIQNKSICYNNYRATKKKGNNNYKKATKTHINK